MFSIKQLHSISFLTILVAVFLLMLWILKPFINILALALILSILFRPLYRLIYSKISNKSISSLLTVVAIVILVSVPIWLFGQIIYTELNNLYDRYRSGDIFVNKDQIISQVPEQMRGVLINLSNDVAGYVGKITSTLFNSATDIISNIASFFVGLFMLLFVLYYLLRDGDTIKAVFMDISPISSNQENRLFSKIVSAVNGVVKGAFLIALVQASIATIGFWIFGIPKPFLWGMFTFVTAFVPNVGTSIALVPAIIYLVVTGHIPQAVGMLIWGAIFVGLIDNFLGPKLIGSSTRLHPVLVLLAVLGGLQFFGLLGFLIGPILMAVFVAMIEIYREEYKTFLSAK
ncbi:MAG: AI-2E family transporter [Candidatus Doudnabacteria bacterium]